MADGLVLHRNTTFPSCAFARALSDKGQHDMPQAIAHRGFKAKYPENTMAAFKGAVDVGAHAIETDVHITKDDVVVLSHDATLKRCFGKEDKIIDCDWSYVSKQRTIAEPQQAMPRLQDLLEYVAQPGLEELWVLLDIKLDNDSDKIMRLIAETIKSVPPPSSKPWKERVVLGCWALKYLPLADKYLPGFPISHIGFSLPYARQFLKVPNVSFNMLCPMLQAPGGNRFIRDCKEAERPIFAWTVNTEDKMDWCIRRKLDGVITDDPEKFLKVCDDFDESRPEQSMSLKVIFDSLRVWFFSMVFGALYIKKLDKMGTASQPVDMK
ncbi:Phosphatidylglycerol phospholipase C-like protein [Elsinoe fawcettii]|nr:Phosphatidylglycerol phospholipase C-like protein [Elsinoe fawcettii]